MLSLEAWGRVCGYVCANADGYERVCRVSCCMRMLDMKGNTGKQRVFLFSLLTLKTAWNTKPHRLDQ